MWPKFLRRPVIVVCIIAASIGTVSAVTVGSASGAVARPNLPKAFIALIPLCTGATIPGDGSVEGDFFWLPAGSYSSVWKVTGTSPATAPFSLQVSKPFHQYTSSGAMIPKTVKNLPAGPYNVSVNFDNGHGISASIVNAPLSVPSCIVDPPPPADTSSAPYVSMAPTSDNQGYWMVKSDGTVEARGDAFYYGEIFTPLQLNSPIVAIVPTSDDDGYWLVGSSGQLFSFGDANFYGPYGSLHPAQPIVGMAVTPSGDGYWLVAADGGVFSYGDAGFHGSTGAIHLNQPIVGMASTPTGQGYYLVARDGGVFAFGDANFRGSMGGTPLNQPVVGMSVDLVTGGYWEVAADGGIFAFGAPFYGSTGNIRLNQPIVGMTNTSTGYGYRFVAADGGIFDYGDAQFFGAGLPG